MIHRSPKRSVGCRAHLLPVVLLVAMSCTRAPSIASFRVDPPARCGPGEARLSWQATGKARLEADPPLANLGEVPSSGSKTVAVSKTTIFKLSVGDGGESKFSRGEVRVISPDASEPFQATAESCESGTVLAAVSVPESDWPGQIVVRSVTSDALRPVRVSHRGTTATLAPDVASEAFRGMPYRGDWTVEMDDTGEGCADAPAAMFLAISLGCSG